MKQDSVPLCVSFLLNDQTMGEFNLHTCLLIQILVLCNVNERQSKFGKKIASLAIFILG